MSSSFPFLTWLRQQKDRQDTVGALSRFAIDYKKFIAAGLEIRKHGDKHDCFRWDLLESFESAREEAACYPIREDPPVISLKLLRMGYKRAWREWLMVLSGQEVIVE